LIENEKATGPEIEEACDIETLRQALDKETEKAEKYLASWQRSQADFSNYKRNTEQEKKDVTSCANSALICNLLPVMDDLERAFASIPPEISESSWTEGIKLIYNKLKTIMETQGLTEIRAEGEPFDPHLHEAVMQQEGEEGIVIQEVQKGYKLKDKLIRPCMVTVGQGKKEKKKGRSIQKEE